MINLRQDQLELKANVYASLNVGNRNVLAVCPTGFGKSVVMSDMCFDYSAYDRAILAHRNELVGQMSLHIAKRGIKHRLIASDKTVKHITALHREEFNGRSFINPSSPCAVVGVQTLIARKAQLKEWAEKVRRWDMDEAHHVLIENQWGASVGMFPNAVGVGWTASPARPDGKGLGAHNDGVFHDMVLGPEMRWLIDNGALCDYEIVCPQADLNMNPDDLGSDGDWSPVTMRKQVEKENSKIVGDVVTEYMRHAMGKQCIVFSTDIKTAGETAERFKLFGIEAVALSSKSDGTYRDEMIKRFRQGRLKVLVNVDLFGEGFDVPGVEVVIMARPTASLIVYLQQFGRVLRVLAGKLFGLLIDLVSNVKRHLFPDKRHFWTLDRREKRAKRERDPEEIDLTVCKRCSKPYEMIYHACPYCGYVAPAPEVTGRAAIEVVKGDLTRLDAATLAAMRKAMQLEAPGALAARVSAGPGGVAGAHFHMARQIERLETQAELNEEIAIWAARQRALGRPDDQSYRRFYLTAGVDVFTALTLDRKEMKTLTQQVRAWNG